MTLEDDLGSVTIDAALRSLLAQHPDAGVGALDPEGIFVPMPASVPLTRHRVLQGRSALDLVGPADRVVAITAWERARATGASRAPVHLRNEPERSVTLHIFDVRETHGAFVSVFVDSEGEDELLFRQGSAAIPPRFARASKSEVAVILEVDDACRQVFGWSEEEMVGKRSLDFIHPEDQELAVDNWMEMLASRGPGRRLRLRHLCKDGNWVWIEMTNHNLLDDPENGSVIAEMVDISDEMAVHEALRAREQLLRRLTESLPVGVLQVDSERRVLYTNDRLTEILACAREATFEELFPDVVEEDAAALFGAFESVLSYGSDCDIEIRLVRNEDDTRQCTLTLRALTDNAGDVNGAIVCVADVTDSAALRAELAKRATYDMLTGCHNRSSMMALLRAELSHGDAEAGIAVMFVDLDRFKDVNDRMGHAAGDEVLVAAADRLCEAVRSDDIVGRIGGDEFLVICPRVRDSDEAVAMASRIAAGVCGEVTLSEGRFAALRASVGVAWSAGHSDSEQLVACADAAMYESKRQAKGKPILALPGIDRRK